MKRTLIAIIGLVWACSSEHPAASSSGTIARPAPTGTTPKPDALPDGGDERDAAPFDPGICEEASMLGEPLEERGVRGDPPVPAGGTLTPGTYVLAELYKTVGPGSDGGPGEQPSGPGTGPTGFFAQKTLVFGDSDFVFLESEGSVDNLKDPVVSGGTYKVDGTMLKLETLCPSKQASRSIGYFASGVTLTLFREASRREVYQRQP